MATTDSDDVPLSAFRLGFEPGYVEGVIDHVLQHRNEASEGARSALNSAISDSIKLDGFRDSSRAGPQQLRNGVAFELLEGNDRLTGAVLRAWAESHQGLHDLATDHLHGLGIPTGGPDLRRRAFSGLWEREAWIQELAELCQGDGGPDEDDVGLMMSYVSGMAPPMKLYDPDIGSETFSEWIDHLEDLPPDAHEWAEIELFIETVTELASAKRAERVTVQLEAAGHAFAAILREFDSELRYLGMDETVAAWEAEVSERPALVGAAMDVVSELRETLEEYRPLHPQADSRDREAVRAVERGECEAAILDLVARWDCMKGRFDDTEERTLPEDTVQSREDDSAATGSGGPAGGQGQPEAQEDGGPPPVPEHSADAGEPETTVSMEEHEALLSERDRLRREKESSEVENARLTRANADLESDSRSLDRENSEIRDELSQSRTREESWSVAYVSARAADAGGAAEEATPPDTVNEAVARVEESFPNQLAISLNSKSAKNSPFQRPGEVFDALAWLATVYHSRRMRPGKQPHFDKLLRESCSGWSYKPKQTEVTKEQFDEWYTTTMDGRSYDLDAHIGKGNSYDPKNTLRIAFAWDDERSKVVVGYIGHHQRTRSS